MSKKEKRDWSAFIEAHLKKCDVSHRGGTVKVDVSELFPNLEEEATMGAYQNYLGGGIAGRICIGSMFDVGALTKKEKKVYDELASALIVYFHNLNNGGGDDYMQENFGSIGYNQTLPVSAY